MFDLSHRRRMALFALLLAAAAAVLLLTAGPGTFQVFNGERVCNPDLYHLDFTRMNQDDSHTMSVQAGDSLRVTCAIRSGRFDLTVSHSTLGMLYRGSSLESGEFELPVSEDGDCTVSVSARNAAGALDIAVRTPGASQ